MIAPPSPGGRLGRREHRLDFLGAEKAQQRFFRALAGKGEDPLG